MRKREPHTGVPNSEFTRLVRRALAHLYDRAYLQNHPLVSMLDPDTNHDRVTRAQGVRRVLLQCIEALRPDSPEHGQAEAVRAYAILMYRYVDGLSMEDIAGKLNLSQRQAYREHKKGVEAVASLLWDKIRERRETSHPQFPIIPGAARERLQVAQAEAVRLQRTMHAESLNLERVLEKVFYLLAPLTQQTGTQIYASSPDKWLSVVADRVMLRQAFLNLLSHALHVVRGDLVITASNKKNGLLIDICESPSVSGTQPVSPSSPKPDGVGLAVAQALIEAQGGHFEVHSDEGRWRVQMFLLTSDGATLLVIDDNADIVALFQRYLGGHKVAVVGVTDGEQALRQAIELQPQVIALDVMMPNQDGWEILQRLKSASATKHIPIVVCSVLNEPQLALSMGASDYITKPVSQVKLLEVLRRWLGSLLVIA